MARKVGFFDSNILIAASIPGHVHHAESARLAGTRLDLDLGHGALALVDLQPGDGRQGAGLFVIKTKQIGRKGAPADP